MSRAARLLALALLLVPAPALPHGTGHGDHAGEPVFAEPERLALPNLPVTDRFGRRSGFRDALPPGRPVILSFTYTACDTLCDISNAVLTVVDADLGSGPGRAATIVTVAIDPERDTPEAMAAEAEKLGAGPGWLWLTGGPRGTRPLLDALRFPAGAVEDHDPMFLVGQPCLGLFTRVVGLADPDALLALARAQPPCDG
jgi:protein SCO1/2